jgi:hypothetical protein
VCTVYGHTFVDVWTNLLHPVPFIFCVILLEETLPVCEVERNKFCYLAGQIEARKSDKIIEAYATEIGVAWYSV